MDGTRGWIFASPPNLDYGAPADLGISMRCALLFGLGLLSGCSGPPADPVSPPQTPEAGATPAAAAPPDPAAPGSPPAAETRAERSARLNREADLRAGLTPGEPLPAWDLSNVSPSAPRPDPTCVRGDVRHLEVRVGSAPATRTAVEALESGPAHVEPPSGVRLQHVPLSLARLVADGAGPATVTSCDGTQLAVSVEQLADPERWLLVRNKKGHVKLIDVADPKSPVLPKLTRVTAVERAAAGQPAATP